MGQCSTLPAEGQAAPPTNCATTSSHFNRDDSLQRPSHFRKSPFEEGTKHFSPTHSNENLQTRNPDVDQMEEDYPRDGIPQPPDIAIRTRCYKLHLDADIHSVDRGCTGPFDGVPPPLTFSTSDDSSVGVTTTQVAIRTAKIFRGITVGKDGTILTQNARATRSNRGSKNRKGEKSRQASKIDKAKDLVEESILTGKAPNSDDPANMISLMVMGEYDDMKHLVRDGAKKLRESVDLPEDAILTANQHRGGMDRSRSPRKRVSPNMVGGHRASTLTTTQNKISAVGMPQSVPPNLKGGNMDCHTSEKSTEDKNHFRETPRYQAVSGVSNPVDGDWSNTLSFSRGFHSIWNCGGARGDDTGNSSIVEVSNQRDGKPHPTRTSTTSQNRRIFEGRESSVGQVRESGIVSRAD